LAGVGAEATVVENGRDAVKLLASESFDVVLMDCQMPLMDGYEATRLIRQQERFVRSSAEEPSARPRRVPIVAMTASAMAGDREKCLRSGMDDYVSKPFTREQLLRVINKWLQQADDAPATGKAAVAAATTPTNEGLGSSATPSEVPADSSPIDEAALDAIRAMEQNGSPGLTARLIDVYLKSSPELVESMRHAVENEDAQTIERSAHSLKSSSATLGALGLAELCKQLETIGREAATSQAAEVFERLYKEFNRVRRALTEQWQETA
jgi:CheY-like chemotaxis protein/HPt (histidine-containing phosphotransfer) domain-containing protein